MSVSDLRKQLKATPIAKLKTAVEKDNVMIGASNNEYLSLVDGKSIKIRIFPAHPGKESFYIARKSYWLSITRQDGEIGRTVVNDSKVHAGTTYDIVDEYIKMARPLAKGDDDKLKALNGERDSLSPSYTWMAYASKVEQDEKLHPMLWEFKKTVRDAINKLSFSEGEDDAIEIDPFTDPDEGLPIMVKYNSKPNRKAGENYYEVSFPKKSVARPLSDEEIEDFLRLKPLDEVLGYTMRDFERALEGLQNFDEEHGFGLFEDDTWLEKVEQIKNQYDAEEAEEKPVKKAAPVKSAGIQKSVKKVVMPEPEPEPEEEEADEDDAQLEGDKYDEMDRNELKRHIKKEGIAVVVKTSMTDDDIRDAIRATVSESEEDEDPEEEAEEAEEAPSQKTKVSLADIRKKLAAGKK